MTNSESFEIRQIVHNVLMCISGAALIIKGQGQLYFVILGIMFSLAGLGLSLSQMKAKLEFLKKEFEILKKENAHHEKS